MADQAGASSSDDDFHDAQEAIQPDFFDSDEGYAASTSTSYVSSIASSIRRGIEENGRLYPTYGANASLLPMDEDELDRNDLQHCKFRLILNDKLHLAPITKSPQNILDLGTGTGIWAIDAADQYATASVIGCDVAAVQPQWTPPNCSFEIEDVENEWLWKKDHFDFIHGREFLLAIRDWPKLIGQAFEHLKPGTGYLELSCSYPLVQSDDGTLPPDSAYAEIPKLFFEIGEATGASGDAPRFYKSRMEAAGFVEVVESVFKVPSSPWPRDKRMKQIGALELANFDRGMEAFTLRGHTSMLDRSPAELAVIMANARKESRDPRIHSYLFFYCVYGRRPAIQGA
jgi:SAM-dependent methyltransferase